MGVSEQQQQTYHQIISFYDLAEELLQTVEQHKTHNPEHQLNRVEPLVLKLEKSTDLLADSYRNFVKTGKKPGVFTRKKIAKALKDIYVVVNNAEEIR
jgi:hypothetical protein